MGGKKSWCIYQQRRNALGWENNKELPCGVARVRFERLAPSLNRYHGSHAWLVARSTCLKEGRGKVKGIPCLFLIHHGIDWKNREDKLLRTC